MSRVHEALQRAGVTFSATTNAGAAAAASLLLSPDLLHRVPVIPYQLAAEALIVDPDHPRDAPSEEFRTLRTRLNHLQKAQPIHTLVVTSASPAEGKSFASLNLALAEAQLSENRTLLCDFDFRRPVLHNLLQIDRRPGITDYLTGRAALHDAMRRIADTNLYVMPAGDSVTNPLELLNLPAVKQLLAALPALFSWTILDSPPLLFAADGNLLATLCDGSILVVRIGVTTSDSIARAMQSLCQDNIVGIVVNAARRAELYSKYTYYHPYDSPPGNQPSPPAAESGVL